MKINFDQNQYHDLLKLTVLGNRFINGKRDVPISRFQDLEKHIVSYAGNFEVQNNGTTFSETVRESNHSRIDISDLIETKEDEYFWVELINRLTARDINKLYGDEIDKVPGEELVEQYLVIQEKYIEEFILNGITNFEISNKSS